MSSTSFPALPGFYRLLFLHFEPISAVSTGFILLFFPGAAAWFHSELIPAPSWSPPPILDARTQMAIGQLANCYCLVGLISSLVFRAVRDALPHDPVAQTKIVGAILTALAIADASHIGVSVLGLPPDVRMNPLIWNPVTHVNVTAVSFLCLVRLAWLAGVGRKSYDREPSVPQNIKSR